MKTIKKSVISIVLALVMIAMPVGDTLTLTPVYADTTVYVTRTGSKYHTHKCGNGTYYASTLSAAIARGLTACAKCFGGSSGYSYTSSSSSSSHASNKTTYKAAPFKLKTTSVFLLKGKTKKIATKNAKGKITWSSNKKSVATVSNGKVIAKGAGKATITAVCNGEKATCKITVEDPKLSATSIRINYDGEKTLKLKGCKHHVSWYTSDSDICEIYNNTVYAYAPGKATIKAKVHGKTYTCKVVVNKPVIKTFSLSDSNMELYSDEQELQYIFLEDVDEDYFAYYNVSAVSSDSDVVEVYDIADGEISLEVNGIGEADITVSFGGKKKICHVVVLAAEETLK